MMLKAILFKTSETFGYHKGKDFVAILQCCEPRNQKKTTQTQNFDSILHKIMEDSYSIPDNTTQVTDPETALSSFAPLAVRLLKGVVYDEETRLWNDLVKVHESQLRPYFAQIGLQLIVNRQEGFAFLRQQAAVSDLDAVPLPRLMNRRTLSLDQSILCLLLRERLDDYTVNDSASREPILSLRDIREIVELFFRERTTHQRFLKDVKKTIKDAKDMGFLEVIGQDNPLNEDDTRYRIKRILKAFVDADELQQLFQQITATIA